MRIAATWMVLAFLTLAAACNSGPRSNCACVATGACPSGGESFDSCGMGFVCCPVLQSTDGGAGTD